MKYIKIGFVALFSLLSLNINAQYAEYEYGGYSIEQDPLAKFSVRPIVEADRMFAKALWLRLDLREKQNEPFKAANNELVKLIIDAAKIGAIKPFTNDSLTTRMTQEEFLENLKVPGLGETGDDIFDEFDDGGFGGGFGYEGGGWGEEEEVEEVAAEWRLDQLYLIEIKENLIFDRKRSRMYHDIESIKIVVPAEFNPKGIEQEIGTFSYKELVKNLFSKNPDAIWYNRDNIAEHRNLQEAFDLRLFSSTLVKYSNPRDDSIDLIYSNPELKMGKALEYMYDLLEYESNTWSN